jgi:hypothetical protein
MRTAVIASPASEHLVIFISPDFPGGRRFSWASFAVSAHSQLFSSSASFCQRQLIFHDFYSSKNCHTLAMAHLGNVTWIRTLSLD